MYYLVSSKDINSIEMVQCQVIRFVFNDYSYNTSVTSLKNILNWPTFQRCRINLRAIMIYKIANNLIRIPADPFLIPVSSYTRNHHHHYKLPYSRVNAHLFSFFPSSLRIWNKLSTSTACSPTLKVFKDRVSKEKIDKATLLTYQ